MRALIVGHELTNTLWSWCLYPSLPISASSLALKGLPLAHWFWVSLTRSLHIPCKCSRLPIVLKINNSLLPLNERYISMCVDRDCGLITLLTRAVLCLPINVQYDEDWTRSTHQTLRLYSPFAGSFPAKYLMCLRYFLKKIYIFIRTCSVVAKAIFGQVEKKRGLFGMRWWDDEFHVENCRIYFTPKSKEKITILSIIKFFQILLDILKSFFCNARMKLFLSTHSNWFFLRWYNKYCNAVHFQLYLTNAKLLSGPKIFMQKIISYFFTCDFGIKYDP